MRGDNHPTPTKAKTKPSWREKLARDHGLPKVEKLNMASAKRWGGKTMAIPASREIDALMRNVPKGRVTTINELRSAVAKKHRAEVGCPITKGIFSWLAAHAAAEAEASGVKNITPYWRTLKTDGEINPKYPGGIAACEKLPPPRATPSCARAPACWSKISRSAWPHRKSIPRQAAENPLSRSRRAWGPAAARWCAP